jgi:hypothetical protein
MSVQPTHNLSLHELDRRSFLHPFTALADHLENGPRVIVEGEGVWSTMPATWARSSSGACARRSRTIHWSATYAARA